MEKLLQWIKTNKAASYIGGLFILFFAAHLWSPLLYLWYALFALFFGYYVYVYIKGVINRVKK